MPLRPFPTLLALALAACSSPEEVAERAGVEATASAEGATAKAAALATGKAQRIAEATELYSFEYSYPAAAARIPALATWLDAQIAEHRERVSAEAAAFKREAEEGGFGFVPHSFSRDWKVVADLPGWLSLSGEIATYAGGAHGMYGRESLVWDKEAGRRLETLALFRSAAALDRALGDRLCAMLDRARAERRGEPVSAGSDDPFDACVGIAETTLLAGSSNGRTFDRIGIWIGPYVAGPYAEGGFEFTLPVDAAVMRAVKPEYRAAFDVAR